MWGVLLPWRNGKEMGIREYLFLFHLESLYLFSFPSFVVKMLDQEKIWSCTAFAELIIDNFFLCLPPFKIHCHVTPCFLLCRKKTTKGKPHVQSICRNTSFEKKNKIERTKEIDAVFGWDLISASLLNSCVLKSHKDSSHTWHRTQMFFS